MPRPRSAASRFTGRVHDYERGRPGYPAELYDALVEHTGIAPGAVVVDLGSGTGLSSAPLVERGFRVVAIEPNDEMRAAAAARFAGWEGFSTRDGSAEATGLAAGSADLALAAQAFHWFDPAATRAELLRVLRPPAPVALVWNARRAVGTPFVEDYEQLLLDYGTDYTSVGHRGIGGERLSAFFQRAFVTLRFVNRQALDRAGLQARLLSSSYVPGRGEPRHEEMMIALDRLFDRRQEDGRVTLDYDTELYLGELADPAPAARAGSTR